MVRRAEFEPDHAAAEHDELFGELLEEDRLARAEHESAVGHECRRCVGSHAGRDHDPAARRETFVSAVGASHGDLARVLEAGAAGHEFAAVRREQRGDPLGVMLDDVPAVRLRSAEVERNPLGHYPHPLAVACPGVTPRRRDQRFRGDAAPVQTHPPDGLALDAGHAQPLLRCSNRCRITAGTAAYDDHVDFPLSCHEKLRPFFETERSLFR